ncbi:hypothetical protein N9260_00290 [bacterium]|nr:hypothetical protein [bacterium]
MWELAKVQKRVTTSDVGDVDHDAEFDVMRRVFFPGRFWSDMNDWLKHGEPPAQIGVCARQTGIPKGRSRILARSLAGFGGADALELELLCWADPWCCACLRLRDLGFLVITKITFDVINPYEFSLIMRNYEEYAIDQGATEFVDTRWNGFL